MRAEFAAALLHDPTILFLDEPTIGLDAPSKLAVRDFVRQLNREQGVTVVVTSHDMAELEQLAGRIVLLHRGQIAFDGHFGELRRSVAQRRVLLLETDPPDAPQLDGAALVRSEAGRHEYTFDSSQVRLATLLEQAASQTSVLDVETHHVPLDDVVADLYEEWLRSPAHG
jgi:ABC-2 type transport system ATP-binding protein